MAMKRGGKKKKKKRTTQVIGVTISGILRMCVPGVIKPFVMT